MEDGKSAHAARKLIRDARKLVRDARRRLRTAQKPVRDAEGLVRASQRLVRAARKHARPAIPTTPATPTTHVIHDNMAVTLSPLEQLPSLVRRDVLANLPLPDIRSLAMASPIFYGQYAGDRQHILRESLPLSLGAAYIDAIGLYRSSTANSRRTRCAATVTQLITSYGQEAGLGDFDVELFDDDEDNADGEASIDFDGADNTESLSLSPASLTPNNISAMSKFHMTTILPLVDMLVNHSFEAILDVGGTSKWSTNPEACRLPLSTSEAGRIVRALYRFQMLFNLFHAKDNWFFTMRTGLIEELYNDPAIAYMFKPWDLHEVVSVFEFLDGSIEKLVTDKKFQEKVYHVVMDRCDNLAEMSRRGLTFILAFLTWEHSTEKFISLIYREDDWPLDFPRRVPEGVEEAYLRICESNPPFNGDHVMLHPDAEYPSLAWTIACKAPNGFISSILQGFPLKTAAVSCGMQTVWWLRASRKSWLSNCLKYY